MSLPNVNNDHVPGNLIPGTSRFPAGSFQPRPVARLLSAKVASSSFTSGLKSRAATDNGELPEKIRDVSIVCSVWTLRAFKE
jgi:hypothetical protein